MKCTQCGCKEFIESRLLFNWGLSDYRTPSSVKVYSCFECGHLEWFDNSPADDYRSKTALLKKYTTELDQLKAQLAEKEKPETLGKLQAEYRENEAKLKSIDITVRQQQEIQGRQRLLQNLIRLYPDDVRQLKEKIRKLENDIRDLNIPSLIRL